MPTRRDFLSTTAAAALSPLAVLAPKPDRCRLPAGWSYVGGGCRSGKTLPRPPEGHTFRDGRLILRLMRNTSGFDAEPGQVVYQRRGSEGRHFVDAWLGRRQYPGNLDGRLAGFVDPAICRCLPGDFCCVVVAVLPRRDSIVFARTCWWKRVCVSPPELPYSVILYQGPSPAVLRRFGHSFCAEHWDPETARFRGSVPAECNVHC